MEGKNILKGLNFQEVPSPSFIINIQALEENLQVLKKVQDESGCKILLALKGFAMWSLFPFMKKYLHGVCASSPDEARLGFEEFKGEVHSYSVAYSKENFKEYLTYSDHVIFNSISQYETFKDEIEHLNDVEFGLRINPGYSESIHEIYDPSAPKSRLGIPADSLNGSGYPNINGLHFHTLCQQNADALERTLEVFEIKCGHILKQVKWLNLGGGHHITDKGYDLKLLIKLINYLKKNYNIDIYLEPGEAVALHSGVLMTTVLDIIHNQIDIAVLDTSAAAHTPDVIEMPYRPNVLNAGLPGELAKTYRLGGLSCLAGDIFGDYSFSEKLKVGDKIIFLDMAHYSMVKNNTFNGIRLPSIGTYDSDKSLFKLIKSFSYEDFKGRLS